MTKENIKLIKTFKADIISGPDNVKTGEKDMALWSFDYVEEDAHGNRLVEPTCCQTPLETYEYFIKVNT